MSKLQVERKPKRGDWYLVSWDDQWHQKRSVPFRGRGARARAEAEWLKVKDRPLARFEGWEGGKHVHIDGWDGRIAVSRDGRPVRQGSLWEGE